MSCHSYIAIDLGADSGRVILGSLQDGRLSLEEIHRFSNCPVSHGRTLRWNLDRLRDEVIAGLQKVAERGLVVESVSVDSWGVDYVLLRADRTVFQQPFCYRDARTETTYPAVRLTLGEEAIYRSTGAQFIPINTLYQLAAEPQENFSGKDCADIFLMIGDWFHSLLCGKIVQEETNASTTQIWEPAGRVWCDWIIQALGLPRRIFPDIVPPCSRLGRLTPQVQAATGLGDIEVVAGCVHDTGAAVAAVPADGKGWAYLSSGTWSLIGVELAAPLLTDEARRANFTNETGACGTTRFLRNASGLWILQECRRAWARQGKDFEYSALTGLAGEAEPFRSLTNPADPAFLRPDDMPGAVSAYCQRTGQPEPETEGQFVRCVLESLSLLYGRLMDDLEDASGGKLHTLHVVGGGSKNALLNQMTADATGRVVIAGPVEATAIGNLLLQALTLGHVASHGELREIVRRSFPVEKYHPRPVEGWKRAKERFSKLA